MSILDNYKEGIEKETELHNKICKKYLGLLKESKDELIQLFSSNIIEISEQDCCLNIYKKGIFKSKILVASVLIIKTELYLYQRNIYQPLCLFLDDNPTDIEIEDSLKTSFSFALKRLI